MLRFIAVFFLFFLFFSCITKTAADNDTGGINEEIVQEDNKQYDDISAALINARIPEDIINNIQENLKSANDFTGELNIILNINPAFWILVDKEHALDSNYVPSDLVLLAKGSYVLNKSNLYLQKDAALSLEEMSAAAKTADLTLVISSTYRSYSYQGEVYSRNANQMGRQAADRVSARPGHSQHQLGLVVDFGSITNAFASTGEGIWLAANASHFGWSLSYPQGMEKITGYSWESWHYRYVGREVTAFIDKYFEGIQQYALHFLHEYKNINESKAAFPKAEVLESLE